ncbi:hypothetical protein GYMLUDRAFT_616861 [Collybiopsis luxurians FD-317 M1]|uniref:Unplaced genomic scaffold GYMLUscaffold_29, whole genome shotgun sequence n=1 Tax=Collybiopsis luxurians FD-317 M1 TaxID=944289 RepID=A0A0D0CVI3_9AGAR|nr:hypothetical protein GYMLUDRAFT_616861 [Collybiopsis luxurians FD-317 M1]
MTFTPPSLNNPILASAIPLETEEISYLAYEGDYATVWDLRRKILEEEVDDSQSDFLSATFLTVRVVSSSLHRLWLFYIGKKDFKPVQDDRLVKVAESTIVPRNLYPCSEECSHQTAPCPNCSSPSNNFSTPPTASKYLPRRPWRRPWNAFLDANGFVIANAVSPPNSDEWVTSGWEQVRSLLYVHVQIQLVQESFPRLVIHPTITRTPYYPLDSASTAGTAVTLLPYGTPAYLVAAYSGPTSALTAQFQNALRGLGVDGWEGLGLGRPKKNGKGRETPGKVNYVILYIPVQPAANAGNRDRRGLAAIYPSRLVLALPPAVRSPMDPTLLPALPAPLQPSPMVPAAIVNAAQAVANGTITSPIGGPRSAYQFPPSTSTTTSTFPTLNSPLGYGYPPPFGNGPGSSSAPGPGAPFPLPPPPSTTYASSASSTTTTGTMGTLGDFHHHPHPLHSRHHPTLAPSLSNANLLRAHRAVSTASRLSALVTPSSSSPGATVASPGGPAAVPPPTPGAPTPGTLSAPTPTPAPGGGTATATTTTTSSECDLLYPICISIFRFGWVGSVSDIY